MTLNFKPNHGMGRAGLNRIVDSQALMNLTARDLTQTMHSNAREQLQRLASLKERIQLTKVGN